MISRRVTLVEDGARELLRLHGYTVRVVSPGFNKNFHRPILLRHGLRVRRGSSASGNFRNLPSTADIITAKCGLDLAQFRKHIAHHIGEAGFHYEIWIYSLTHGFRCFEVLMDSIREIPKLSLHGPEVSRAGGVAWSPSTV